MTISVTDDPYLRVVSEFDAATTPIPTHRPAPVAFLARVVSRVALGFRRDHHCSQRPRLRVVRPVDDRK
jgi:hypothetical protein